MTITVFCTTQFEGFHCWPQAPREVDYLRSLHRHVFHVRAEKKVNHGDREIEFISLKLSVNRAVGKAKEGLATQTWSCERWAQYLLTTLNLSKCEVSEDGENGAIVEA